MNIIFKIILLNIVLFITLKYSFILFIILLTLISLWVLYMTYKVNNILEGNMNIEDYKMNFVGILNKDIKINMREDKLYDSILDNFTKLIKLIDKTDNNIPPNQMCKGELGDWTNCTKNCGRGKKTRRFNVLQKAGETGIDCIYENGQMESSECFERLCKFNEACEDNMDCISGYCSESDKLCSYKHMCTRDQLYNCNSAQCQKLKDKYGEYTYDTDNHECINKNININFRRFEINEDTLSEVEGVKDEETTYQKQAIKYGMEQSRDTMCRNYDSNSNNNNTPSCSNTDMNDCEGHFEVNDDIIMPCHYNETESECERVDEVEEYGGFPFEEIVEETLKEDFWGCQRQQEQQQQQEEITR